MSFLRGATAIIGKDLRLELRTRRTAGLVIVLGLLIVTVLGLGLRPGEGGRGAAAILWVAYLFSGMLCFERTMSVEREDNALAALVLSPAGPGALYAAKLVANLVMILAVAAVATPVGVAFFGLDLAAPPAQLLAVLGLSLLGLAAVGTLFSAAVSGRRAGGALPLLVLPLLLPLVLVSTAQLAALESGQSAAPAAMPVLLAFDAIFVTAGWMAYEHILDP